MSNTNLMSSLFPGLPFPPSVFPPLIDMSSTQTLIALARAAKDAEIQQLLKTTQQKITNISPIPKTQINHQNSSSSSSSSFSSPQFSLQNFQQQMNVATSPSSITQLGNQSHAPIPLDLSSTPVSKRMKVESTSPNPSPSSPSTSQQQQQFKVNLLNCTGGAGGQTHQKKCHAQSEEINGWNVEQVCSFVGGIDICAEYVQVNKILSKFFNRVSIEIQRKYYPK